MSDRFSAADLTWEGFISLYLHLEVRAVATIWYEMSLLVGLAFLNDRSGKTRGRALGETEVGGPDRDGRKRVKALKYWGPEIGYIIWKKNTVNAPMGRSHHVLSKSSLFGLTFLLYLAIQY